MFSKGAIGGIGTVLACEPYINLVEGSLVNILRTVSPNAAELIRMDHTRVLALFHRYRAGSRPSVKQGLVRTACLAIEVHAQIEEEIFYPALQFADRGLIEKSIPEHEEMRRLIAALRGADAGGTEYDSLYLALMRQVLHHVADEETVLLPAAERSMGDRLNELGARMARRRVQLLAPRTREMAIDTARSHPAGMALAAAGTLMAAFAVKSALRRR